MPIRSRRAARLSLLILPLVLALAAHGVRADSMATVIPFDGLRLRAGPSADQPALDLIPGGARIAVTGQSTPDGWYPVVYHQREGWVLGSFLAFDDAAAAPHRATVTPADGLNLRRLPLTTADVITVLAAGTIVTATGPATSDGWALVAVAEQSGWVNTAYLAFDGAAPPPPATPGTASAPAAAAGAGAIPMKVSYYSPSFEGSPLACGGVYHANDETIAATNRWPCGTVLRICRNGVCIMVAVRDRGGMALNEIDVSYNAFTRIAIPAEGQVPATLDVIGP